MRATRTGLTLGLITTIIATTATPAHATSASARSKPYVVTGATCYTSIRLDDWTRGKVRATATAWCNKKMLQINIIALLKLSGRSKNRHLAHCGFARSCTAYAYATNPGGRQAWKGVASSLVNDSFLTFGANVTFAA